MSRPITLRVSYAADAGYLNRLQTAVGLDTRRSPEWRRALITILNEAVALLVMSDESRETLARDLLKRLEAKKSKKQARQ